VRIQHQVLPAAVPHDELFLQFITLPLISQTFSAYSSGSLRPDFVRYERRL
jgi:hypothetical protein